MASIDAVKRALRALATRTDTARPPAVAVVTEAEAALADVRRAAAFVDAVGLDRLDAAVTEVAEAGRRDAAERGREALAAYRSYRTVATDGETDGDPIEIERPLREPTSDRRAVGGDTADRIAEGDSADRSDERDSADHFHPARGTHKRGAGQESSE